MKKYFLSLLMFLLFASLSNSQSLLDLLEDEEEQLTDEYTTNTFFSTRVVNGQSVETPFPKNLIFVISHHFGSLNLGPAELWGIDQATIRIGFDYGINDRLSFSIGRSTYEKTFDTFFKYRILRQTQKDKMPISATLFSGAYLRGAKWANPDRDYDFAHRLSYVNQLLIARKFSEMLSVQLTPVWVHKNLVGRNADFNDQFLLGIGGRLRVTKWVSLTGEYFQRLNVPQGDTNKNSLSLGFDFDTGGHIFQLHFTNSKPMFERGFLTETTGNWLKGDIYFGFNITRVFSFNKTRDNTNLPSDHN
jgi:hypothetical protein